jgi:hypothetical protein
VHQNFINWMQERVPAKSKRWIIATKVDHFTGTSATCSPVHDDSSPFQHSCSVSDALESMSVMGGD